MTTITPPKCSICRHFNLVPSIKPNCKAFPKGIPENIWLKGKDHSKPMKDQENDIVYEEMRFGF
jgi:hypothetical protein